MTVLELSEWLSGLNPYMDVLLVDSDGYFLHICEKESEVADANHAGLKPFLMLVPCKCNLDIEEPVVANDPELTLN